MSATYRAAVIGVGRVVDSGQKGGGHRIGYNHAEMFKRQPRVSLDAGVDIVPENLEAWRRQFAVPQGFADVPAMLRAVQPHIVSIGTYVGLHRQFLETCAEAGVRGIVCEKPFVASPADIDAVHALVQRTGVKIVVAHVRRYRPSFARVRQLIHDGAIGRVIACLTSLGGWDLTEMGSHWFDLIRMFNGDRPVKWVFGQARTGDFRGYGHAMEESAVAHFAFDDGARGIIEAGEAFVDDANFNFTIVGSAGVIRAKHELDVVIETVTGQKAESYAGVSPAGWSDLGLADHPAEWMKLWDMLLGGLMRWMEGGPESPVSAANALRTLEVNYAAYLSAWKGDRVDLPLVGDLRNVSEYPVELLARRPRG